MAGKSGKPGFDPYSDSDSESNGHKKWNWLESRWARVGIAAAVLAAAFFVGVSALGGMGAWDTALAGLLGEDVHEVSVAELDEDPGSFEGVVRVSGVVAERGDGMVLRGSSGSEVRVEFPEQVSPGKHVEVTGELVRRDDGWVLVVSEVSARG